MLSPITKALRSTWMYLIFAGPAAAYFLWFGYYHERPLSSDPNAWAEFGDFIGGVLNPVVAVLALTWLVRSVQIQRQELSDTRDVLKKQADTLSKQAFESTFFALLDQHRKMLDEITAHDSLCTRPLRNRIAHLLENHSASAAITLQLCEDELKSAPQILFSYFRLFRSTIKIIEENALINRETIYVDLIKSQIPPSILILLALHSAGITDKSPVGMKAMLERHRMLTPIEKRSDPLSVALREHYTPEAYNQ